MAEITTIAELGTAGGTLVLALATFASTRSANRAARVAERSLLAGLRPTLVPSRPSDPDEIVPFTDRRELHVSGGSAAVLYEDDQLLLAVALRNVGSGLAVLQGWYLHPGRATVTDDHADPSEFRRAMRDIYIAPGDTGYWQGAIREPTSPIRDAVGDTLAAGGELTLELLYSDQEGAQRFVTRYALLRHDDGWNVEVGRHWSLDGPSAR